MDLFKFYDKNIEQIRIPVSEYLSKYGIMTPTNEALNNVSLSYLLLMRPYTSPLLLLMRKYVSPFFIADEELCLSLIYC